MHDWTNLPDPRWIISSLAGVSPAWTQTLLAVSTSEDPTAYTGWYFYSVQSCPDGSGGDQPRLGVNRQWVVLFIDCANGNNQVWIFDKANLYAGGALNGKAFSMTASASYQDPAVEEPGTSFDEFLVGIDDPIVACAGGSFGCFSKLTFNSLEIGLVSGSVDSPVYTGQWATAKLPSSGYYEAPAGHQLGTTVLVGNEQAIVNSAMLQVSPDGNSENLYTAFPLGLPASAPARSGVEWAQLNDLGQLDQSGIIQDTSNVASYHTPSIAVSQAGYGLLGYSDFSKNYYPRADYQIHLTLPDSQSGGQEDIPDEDLDFAGGVLVTSQTNWTGDACACNRFNCTTSGSYECARWGDDSTTVIDPDGPPLWTLQEYINQNPTPPPSSQSLSPSPSASPTPSSQVIQDTEWSAFSAGP